ncbi:MAG: hypothetical protein SNJ70_03905 [Armatimonadota bacterium]
MANRLEQENSQMIIYTDGDICATTRELVRSNLFKDMFVQYIKSLEEHDSPLLEIWENKLSTEEEQKSLLSMLGALAEDTIEKIAKILPDAEYYFDKRNELVSFVEGFYNYWRSFDRFMVCRTIEGPESFDKRPYNTFANTSERLNHLVRALYRDICEKISGIRPRVYRQIPAGCEVALIAVEKQYKYPEIYSKIISNIPFIRQVFINPPLVVSPSASRRSGQIQKVDENPLLSLSLDNDKWLCYPAQVGNLVINIYFHQKFICLGSTLANLFEIASDEQVSKGPDAVCVYGASNEQLEKYGELPAVFFDDEANNLVVAAISDDDRMGFFGNLRRMVLTLHNVVMIKRGRMPFRGSMVRIELKNGKSANVLLIGVTAAGKRETLEALQVLGENNIRNLKIIADDMGSFEISDDDKLLGYGTEIGAFIDMADYQQGYAFGQIDRAIIMNPHSRRNARIALPVTTMDEVLKGYPVDIILYTNNYEEIDNRYPTIERFTNSEVAIKTFRDAATMSKGTTISTGVAHTYFANPFGASDYMEVYDEMAKIVFEKAIDSGVFVGQIRTRLGIKRYGERGPDVAAEALLDLISNGWIEGE